MITKEEISTDMPYQSQYVEVLGEKMHYVEEGEGDPVLFLHGMPTSCYLWRNVMPHLTKQARCIAVDLIGMGKSAKPDISYRVFDHIKYIEGFIKALNLRNVTLVMHGWGSVIGFHYASKHEKNVKALAFYESLVRPLLELQSLSLPLQQLASLLKKPGASYKAIVENNFFVEKLLPGGILRKLSSAEMNHYRRPFKNPKYRKVLWQFVLERPLGGGQSEVTDLIQSYSDWLQRTPIPKLMFYVIPGFITTMETVAWAKKHLSNLTLIDLGEGLHFIQESNPHAFGKALADWHAKL